MMRFALALIATMLTSVAFGQAQFPAKDTSHVPGYVQECLDVNGNAVPVGAGCASGSVTTTVTNSTISVTNTFQQALAASSSRKSCLIQNTGTHVEFFYFGTIGSATISNAFQVNPGQTISCATPNGLVLTDAVNVAGTSGDGYVAVNQ
jgi:hypothetical protein